MLDSTFDKLNQDIEAGIRGETQSIPIGLAKLGKYASIRKNILTLIFSTTGAGKSSLLDTMILNACESHMNSPTTFKMKPDFQLFSMERASKIRVAKWVSFFVFRHEGVEIQIPRMLGWWNEKLSKKEHELILSQKDRIDCLLNDYVTIHDGAKSSKAIYKIMKDHFEDVGEYDKIKAIDKKSGKERQVEIYIPNNPDIVVVPAFDHGNLIKTSQEYTTKKSAIDKTVEFVQGFRDLEGAAPIWISQVNRAISGVTRSKDSEQELQLEDVKESGDIVDACDIAISLFDPLKYKQSSKTGYSPEDFVDKDNGNNFFRSAQILKSSYGADGIRIPLAFNGFCGEFKEMGKRSDLTESQYQDLIDEVLSKRYFL